MIDFDKVRLQKFIDCNIDDRLVSVTTEFVVDAYVRPLLGSIYDELSNTEPDDWSDFQKELYERYIVNIVGWYTMAEIQIPLTYKTKQSGAIQITGDNHNVIGINEVNSLKAHYQGKGEMYVVMCSKFLEDNGYSKSNVKFVKNPIKI